MSHQTSSAADYLKENPYELPEEHGHVFKFEIFAAVRLTSYNFRHFVAIICGNDEEFAKEYEPFKTRRVVPIALAEKIVRKIVDNDACIVNFYRKEARLKI